MQLPDSIVKGWRVLHGIHSPHPLEDPFLRSTFQDLNSQLQVFLVPDVIKKVYFDKFHERKDSILAVVSCLFFFFFVEATVVLNTSIAALFLASKKALSFSC